MYKHRFFEVLYLPLLDLRFFHASEKLSLLLTHTLLSLRSFHVWWTLYNLFVRLILPASFNSINHTSYRHRSFTSFRSLLFRWILMSYLTKMDGGFEPPLQVHHLKMCIFWNNFVCNHSVPTHTRICHAQQNSFRCCHPPYIFICSFSYFYR